MSREIVCPHCGTSVHVHESALIAPAPPASEAPPGDPAAVPSALGPDGDPGDAPGTAATPPIDPGAAEPTPVFEEPILTPAELGPLVGGLDWLRSSGSGEVLSADSERPDHAPGTIATEDAPAEVRTAPPVDPFLGALAQADPIPEAEAPLEAVAVVPGLDISGPSAPQEANGHGRPSSEELPALETETGRSSLGMVLLGSYASAITLALLWVLWRGQPSGGPVAPTLPASSRSDIDGDGDRAFVARLTPIPAVHTTKIGHPLLVGDLEITPLSIELGSVRLVSATSRRKRDGGDEALQLRVRLRNLSESLDFAPLEPGFIREPDRGVPESLIVADDHLILPYRLATQSEWEIPDQEFTRLAPGAEFETVIVSEASARTKLASEMTWRLRVRTGSAQTHLIGVQFKPDQIDGP